MFAAAGAPGAGAAGAAGAAGVSGAAEAAGTAAAEGLRRRRRPLPERAGSAGAPGAWALSWVAGSWVPGAWVPGAWVPVAWVPVAWVPGAPPSPTRAFSRVFSAWASGWWPFAAGPSGALASAEGVAVAGMLAAGAGISAGRERAATEAGLAMAERGHLGDLVLGPVPGQALEQPAQHQFPVALEHHVDEVDDHDAAHIAQPELADDLLGGLEVVPGDGLLQVPALAGELARVDVDDRHRLGLVDDERPAARQPDLALERLGQLLVDT